MRGKRGCRLGPAVELALGSLHACVEGRHREGILSQAQAWRRRGSSRHPRSSVALSQSRRLGLAPTR
eukprot:10897000-Alexandrium_andersonii.AAC.1